MSEPKKVGRRTFLNYAIAVVATGVIVGAATYFAVPKGEVTVTAPGTTVTTTKTVTTTVTGTPTTSPISGKISWWVGSWSEECAKGLANEFMKSYPNIEVEVVGLAWEGMYDKMLSALPTAASPDVLDVAVAWNIPFAQLDLLMPLDQYISSSPVIDLSDFYEPALATAKVGGKLYGIPFRTEVGGLVMNKTIAKKSGLDPEKAPTNWDEFYEYCKKATIPGSVYGTSMGFGEKLHAVWIYSAYLWGNGGDILTPDYKTAIFNSDAGVEALDFLVKLYKEGLMPKDAVTISGDDARDQYFVPEKALMMMGAVYFLPTIKQNNPSLYSNLLIAPYVKQPRGFAQYVQIGGWNRVISKRSKNPEAAWKLIEFLSTPEKQAWYTHTFPARKSGLKYKNYYGTDFSDPYVQAFAKCNETGRLPPPIPQWGAINEILAAEIVNALTGAKSSKKALDDAANKVNELLK